MKQATLVALASFFVPHIASAQQGLSQTAGLFNIMVGLMLVAAFLLFFGGLGMWFARLGTWPTYRDEGISLMQWGVGVLFVLAILLAVVQFVQKHAALAAFLVGVVIVIGVAILLAKAQQAGGEDNEH